MSFDDFLNYLKSINVYFFEDESSDLIIQKKWNAGGMTGGSCWGTVPCTYCGDSEPEFKDLDLIIENINPEIKFMEYRKLLKELDNIMISKYQSIYEYYGNYTDYEIRNLRLKDLYEIFLEKGWLSNI